MITGFSQIIQTGERLAEKALLCFGMSCWEKIEIDRVSFLIQRTA